MLLRRTDDTMRVGCAGRQLLHVGCRNRATLLTGVLLGAADPSLTTPGVLHRRLPGSGRKRGRSRNGLMVGFSTSSERADEPSVNAPIRLRYGSTCGTCALPLPVGAYADYEKAARTTTCMACVDAAGGTVPGAVGTPGEDVATIEPLPTIRLRYQGVCADCGTVLPKGSEACWDRAAKTARCSGACAGVAEVIEEVSVFDVGIAGGSARKIAARQQAKRDQAKAAEEEAIREAMPVLGGAVVGLRRFFAEPEKPTSYAKGADGEEAVGRTFARLTDEGFVVLHDRRKPGTKWNIDHVVVGPRGVYVVDAKNYKGRLEIRTTGSIFRPGPNCVFLNGRSLHKRVDAMGWQVDTVTDACQELLDGTEAVIKPVLCFLGVELGLTQQPMLVGPNSDVLVTWPRRFVKDVGRDGPLSAEQVQQVARRIADRLPAAVAA